ncbi:MAG: 50S ribosomal protein L9 [Bacteroidia bacterium]|nr:50S ribosomal protein L9 [Bacteroidia bacterium]
MLEVILKKEVQNLGSKDEIVKVRPGYARNFLVPQGIAVMATESNRKVHAENLRQRAHKEAKILEDAKAMAEKISAQVIKIGAKAGENGKIFGSVNTVMLADAYEKAGIPVDRRQIALIGDDTIKQLGNYKANIKLHKEVSVEVDFEVIGE